MKLFKITLILSIVIIIGWIIYLFLPKILPKKEIIVPNLSNMDVLEAIDVLKENNLNYKTKEIENHNKRIVLYTEPMAYTTVKEKSVVVMYITKTYDITIPDYTYQDYNQNKISIEDFCLEHDINLYIEYQIDNDYPEGIIIKQSQPPNEIISNTSLILTINKNDNMITMKNLIGLNALEAKEYLDSNKLNVTYEYLYSIKPFNTVIGQSLKNNEQIIKGNKSEIIVYVSKGLHSIEDLIGLSFELTKDKIAYLPVEIIKVKSNNKSQNIIAIEKKLYYDNSIEMVYLYISE